MQEKNSAEFFDPAAVFAIMAERMSQGRDKTAPRISASEPSRILAMITNIH